MSESINRFAQLILADSLFEHCKSESLSEEGLREIIERFGLSPNIKPRVCDYKFFIQACINERVTEGIIQCLLEYFPGAAMASDDDNDSKLPLHYACRNPNVTLEIVQLLIDAAPDSVRSVDNEGRKPLHYLCKISKAHEMTALEILELLVEKHPGAIRHADNEGCLQIHYASGGLNKCCSILVEAYPGSERIGAMDGALPFHFACGGGTLATVKYLYKLYPDAINHAADGFYPIRYTIGSMDVRDDPTTAMDIVKFLLDCDPNVKLQKGAGVSLLRVACGLEPNDSNIEAGIHRCSTMSELFLADALFEHCKSESLSEEVLRKIIELFGLSPNDNHRVSNYTFFLEACLNERVTEGIIQCLLEYFPAAVMATDNDDNDSKLPLHYACGCGNKNMTLEIVQLLIDAAPDSVRSVDTEGCMPLHCLCLNKFLDEITAMEILKLLVEKHPGAIKHADNDGFLPVHIACLSRSPEFCRVLIEAYHESERVATHLGALPFHFASAMNTAATVEYLYKLYPDAINHAATDGHYPIHYAILGMNRRDDPKPAVDIVEYLLDCDPNVKLQKLRGMSLLLVACVLEYEDSNIRAGIEVIKAIYDANPEAIEYRRISPNIHHYHQQVRAFINSQLVYSRQAKNHRQMTTPDGSGHLPLHTALQSNVRLGSIKLLAKGNPLAVQSPDNRGALPLHVACEHHDYTCVVQYLAGLDTSTLSSVDGEGNTVLHYACRGAKYDTIAMFLDKYDAVSVSKRNAQKKLPIDLLWESSEFLDRESVEYTESVFRLLKAYPETLTINIDMNMEPDATQIRKKRKVSGYSGT